MLTSWIRFMRYVHARPLFPLLLPTARIVFRTFQLRLSPCEARAVEKLARFRITTPARIRS